MNIFYERLVKAMDAKGMRPIDLSEKSGVSRGMISHYLHDGTQPKAEPLFKLAKALDVRENWLIGQDDIMKRPTMEATNDIHPIIKKSFPLLGSIACGEPIFADENLETFVQADKEIDADFCLLANGDSMIEANINDGDIVFIKQKNQVLNGKIAVVLINDEATLKRVYFDKEKNILTLVPANPKYQPMVIQGEELERTRILGEAVFFQRYVE